MIYEPKLEPPKFNPDLASLSSSNNFISSNSVTLTPVSSFSSDHKSGSFSSEARSSSSSGGNNVNKTPNVVVKIGKHGEVYHAKKDSPSQSNGGGEGREPTEGILERVSPGLEVKEESACDKSKSGFTTANFTESFVTASVSVTAALIKSDTEPSGQSDRPSSASRVKVESPEFQQDTEPPTSSLGSSSSSSSLPQSQNSSASSPSPAPPSSTSSGLVFSLEPQQAPPPPVPKVAAPTSKPPSSSMFPSRHGGQSSPGARHGLTSSVSLFPTSSVGPPPPPPHPAKPGDGPHPPPSSHSSVSITPASVTSPSTTLTVSRLAPTSSQPVTISPVSLDTGEPRLSHDHPIPTQAKPLPSPSALLSPRSKAAQGTNGPVKRVGRPPKPKGTHTTNSSLGTLVTLDSDEEETASSSKRSRTDSGHGERKLEEGKKEGATDNGLTARFMMFGATLNPSSGVAKEMSTVLQVIQC